jgi:hypothetical protein
VSRRIAGVRKESLPLRFLGKGSYFSYAGAAPPRGILFIRFRMSQDSGFT